MSGLARYRWMLRLLSWTKIPLIGFCRPKLIHLDEFASVLRINLRRRTKNHLKSMYFGALCVGADVCAGLPVFYLAEKHKVKVSFAFKGFKANFLKRAESDVLFKCESIQLIEEHLLLAIESKERKNLTVSAYAYDRDNEIVAEFELILSFKVK